MRWVGHGAPADALGRARRPCRCAGSGTAPLPMRWATAKDTAAWPAGAAPLPMRWATAKDTAAW